MADHRGCCFRLSHLPIIGNLLNENELNTRQLFFIGVASVAGLMIQLIGTWFAFRQAGYNVTTFKGYTSAPCIMYATGIFVLGKYAGRKIMKISVIQHAVSFLSGFTFGIYLIHWYIIDFLLSYIGCDLYSLTYRLGAPFLITAVSVGMIWILRKIPVLRAFEP